MVDSERDNVDRAGNPSGAGGRDAVLDRGIAAHQAGDHPLAESAYRTLLALDPEDPDALHLLGVLAYQAGRTDEAISLLSRSVSADPEAGEFQHDLGEALLQDGRLADAVSAFRRAVELDGTAVATYRRLGELYQRSHRFADAVVAWERAVELDGGDALARNNLAVSYRHLGRPADAVGQLDAAIAIDPTFADAYRNLARAYFDQRRYDDATAAARRLVAAEPVAASHAFVAATLNAARRFGEAIDEARLAAVVDPDCLEAHFQLGLAFQETGEVRGAALAFGRAADLQPGLYSPHLKLGLAHLALGDAERAAQAFSVGTSAVSDAYECWYNMAIAYDRGQQGTQALAAADKVLEIRPGWGPALVLKATLNLKFGRHAEAERLFRQAVDVDPELVEGWSNLSGLYADRGDHPAAIDALSRAMALRPGDRKTHDMLCFFLNSDHRVEPRDVYEEHARWGTRETDVMAAAGVRPTPAAAFANHPAPARRLRVGYVSPDYRAHSVSFFIGPLLKAHDRGAVEVYCYDDAAKPDLITAQLQARSDHWRRVVSMSDDALAEQVRRDQIDVLVDLAGHTADNRLGMFARRAAPVQVSYLGYPTTTGVPTIDYRLTDEWVDPPDGDADDLHTERLVRLPAPFLAYGATPDAPPVAALPADAAGHVTFASFNALPKVNPPTIAIWARILTALPTARLLLKANGLHDPSTAELYRSRFADHGVDPDRLILVNRTVGFVEHMSLYARCDIALDPFPYNGTTTTCEALWMGVPVVALAGRSSVSRVGVSLLSTTGLADWIAATPDAYVDLATAWAGDLDRLRELRAGLRGRVQASPLRDPARLARNVERAYRDMWERWCGERRAAAVGS